jgi:hypothetical protein
MPIDHIDRSEAPSLSDLSLSLSLSVSDYSRCGVARSEAGECEICDVEFGVRGDLWGL